MPHLRAEYARWVSRSRVREQRVRTLTLAYPNPANPNQVNRSWTAARDGAAECLWQACHDDGQVI